MEAAVAGCVGCGGEVHHKGAVVELEDVRCPDFGVGRVNPGWEVAEGVVVLVELPGCEVGGCGVLGLDGLIVEKRLSAERVPGITDLDDGWIREVGLDDWADDISLEQWHGK